MALSSYLNSDALQAMNQEISTFHHPQPDESYSEFATPNQLLPYYSSDESFSHANTVFDSYADPILFPELYFSWSPQSYECGLPAAGSTNQPIQPLTDCYFSNPNAVDCKQSGFQPNDYQYNLFRRPKRRRICYDNQYHHQEQYSSLDIAPANFFDGFSPHPHCSFPSEEPLPELLFSTLPEFKVPALPISAGNCVGNIGDYDKKGNEKSVSPQSIAARERRRKITEKTQELGNLIPNGNNMNTAEMFSAAAKYVKFLQAQVDMLRLINTLEEEEKEATPIPNEDLKSLLDSTSVQEKLYLEEKCFVPKQLVTTLTNDPQLQTQASILKDLSQLIAKNIDKD